MSLHTLLLTCALALCGAALARAQEDGGGGVLAGRVLDSQGARVAGAAVTLRAREPQVLRLIATTDAEGSYSFARLAPGEYLVQAESVGFAPAAPQKVRVAPGRTETLDLTLEVAGVRAEVVVTAAAAPQPIDEVSKAIGVVAAAEIEARNEFAIADALRTVPGLRVQQLGGPGSLVSIKTRGLRNEDTAVLIDGLRFRDAAAITGDATGYLEDLILTNTSRLEVLRGSGSSLYGTNAIGGVVNVVTDEGGGPLRGSLLAEGGGLGFFRGRAQVAGGAGEANRFAYSAGVSHLNVARGVDGDDAARTTSGQGRVTFRLTPTATLSSRLYAADSFVQLNSNPDTVGALPPGIIEARPLAPGELRNYEAGASIDQLNAGAANFIPSANDPDASRVAQFLAGAVLFTHRPAEAFGYTLSYQGLRTSRTLRNGPGGVSFQPFGGTSQSDFEGRIHTLNGRTDIRLGRLNHVTAGYEFEQESFHNRSFLFTGSGNTAAVATASDSNTDATQRSHTFFIQDQVRLLDDRLQLSAAFRVQRFTLDQPEFTPAATAPYQGRFAAPPTAYTGDGSVAYLFRSTGTKLRGHVGNGYRAPSLYERFGTFFSSFSNSFVALGDPGLRPERSLAFDAGIDQTAFGNRLRASATYFYTRLQEVVGFGDVATFNRFFGGYLNTGGGLARGVELSLAAAPAAKLDVTASYTYTNSDQRRPAAAGVVSAFRIPDHQFSLVATQRVTRRLLLNLDLTGASDYLEPIFSNTTFSTVVYRFGSPVKADVSASYTLPLSETRRLRFFGHVENLFDREYYESGFRTSGVTGRAGAQFNF